MEKKDRKMFKDFLKNPQYDKKLKLKILNQYKDELTGQVGGGKLKGGKLIAHIQQNGGSWSAFKNFFTRTIPNAAKTVYNKALKPAGELAWKGIKKGAQFVKDKPLTSLKWAAKAASMVAPPGVSSALNVASNALGTVADATGKGMTGGMTGPIRMNGGSKVLLYF